MSEKLIDPVDVKKAIEKGELLVTIEPFGFPPHKGIYLSAVSHLNGQIIVGDTVRIGECE